jgi:hypothetical protein
MSEKFQCPKCPRGAFGLPVDNHRFEVSSPLEEPVRRCTGCGGIHFDDLMVLMDAGIRPQQSDKPDKGYITRPKTERLDAAHFKFYVCHFTPEQLARLNERVRAGT